MPGELNMGDRGGMERKRDTESVEINKDTVTVSSNNVTNCVLIVPMFLYSVEIDYPYAAGPIWKICE